MIATRMRRWLAVPILALPLVASGCAQSSYPPETADAFRAQVMSVTQASAAGDWAGALAALDQFVVELTAARDGGRLDERRFDHIMATVALVRGELEALIAAAQQPASPPPPPPAEDDGEGDDGRGNGNEGNNGNGNGGNGNGGGGGNGGNGNGGGNGGGGGGNSGPGGGGGGGGGRDSGSGGDDDGDETEAPEPEPSATSAG